MKCLCHDQPIHTIAGAKTRLAVQLRDADGHALDATAYTVHAGITDAGRSLPATSAAADDLITVTYPAVSAGPHTIDLHLVTPGGDVITVIARHVMQADAPVVALTEGVIDIAFDAVVNGGGITLSLVAGRPGKSAYETWLDEGHTGSTADYVAALKGDKGEPGEVTQAAFDAHTRDNNIHVSSVDKAGWNDHVSASDIHLKAGEREAWSGYKEPRRYGQCGSEIMIPGPGDAGYAHRSITTVTLTGTMTSGLIDLGYFFNSIADANAMGTTHYLLINNETGNDLNYTGNPNVEVEQGKSIRHGEMQLITALVIDGSVYCTISNSMYH